MDINIYDLIHCDMYEINEQYRTIVNDLIVKCLENNGGSKFFGYMFGEPFYNIHSKTREEIKKDELIEMSCNPENISNDKTCFFYIWGWPGPDYNKYNFIDYGITWAFTKEEIKPVTLNEWKNYKEKKQY